ncbi:MAG: 3-carboxy-cis,cis-muconate cycloisomerase [Acidobacteriia bacterium]|nr:3-carboxy-cis,cis-muconate cycloisomerase [Terriglobia bacterium]
MAVRLIDSLATTAAMEKLFCDESVLQAMLDFEAALARTEARLGIIPQSAADTIAKSAEAKNFDSAALARAALRAGTPGIPLVKALTERVRAIDAGAAGYVHWGATSQDVADTGLVLLLKQAQLVLESDLARLEQALERLSEQRSHTVMLGRTLMQAAPPVTFGLKAAGWLAAIRRSHAHLQSSFADALVLQFGGAVGTLAALGDQGLATARALAEDLGIGCPDAPWHTHRDRLAVLVCALGVLTGTLGKMARDISLLMQNEIGEVAEPGGEGRGGSSTMPHKRNPIGSTVTLAAANRVPGLVSSFLSGMIQENERGVGGWQAEWPTMSAIVQSAGLAVASMAEVAEGLTVDAEKMRANIAATNGVVFAERAMILLGKALGRDVAHRVLEEATRRSVAQRRHLAEVLAEMPEVTDHLAAASIRSLEDSEQYLGVADTLRKQLLAGNPQRTSKTKRK